MVSKQQVEGQICFTAHPHPAEEAEEDLDEVVVFRNASQTALLS